MKQAHKTIAFWLFLAIVALLAFTFIQGRSEPKATEIEFSELQQRIKAGEVVSLVAEGEDLSGEYRPNGEDIKKFTSHGNLEAENTQLILREANLLYDQKEKREPRWQLFLIYWLPLMLVVFVFFFFFRQVNIGGGRAMQFGKSKARLLSDSQKKVTFEDVAGIEEAKDELEEIIEFLREPRKFSRLGGQIPKGVLLMGGPGTGKTLLARAIAGEAGVPFFSISGSDFVEMFVGVGASRVRDLFEQGKKNAPCIIFIDEIDAVGRHRGAGLGGGHDEREQTLNQLLVEMDGFESNDGVILIAATNRPDVLDPALLRPGRFDRRVVVPLPDVKGRKGILEVHTRGVVMADGIDLEKIARGTPGFSGADLRNLANEAALAAASHNKDQVEQEDFELAKDKVMMGSERRSLMLSENEKRDIAYHEAGHAIVAELLPNSDPVHKVTIIPRGQALGLTQQLPVDERHTYDRKYLISNITILMGGRAAEELALERTTTGAGNDIERATDVARKMVCEWGMSDRLGPLSFGKKEEQIFLGREMSRKQDYSDQTAVDIDGEVRSIVTSCYDRAKQLLTENMQALHDVANELLVRESLGGADVERFVQGLPPRDPDAEPETGGGTGPVSEPEPEPEPEAGPESEPVPVPVPAT